MNPDATLKIEEKEEGYYSITPFMQNELHKPYELSLPKEKFRQRMRYLTSELKNILGSEERPKIYEGIQPDVYRRQIEIPPNVCQDDLETIAVIDLSEDIFPSNNPLAQKYKEWIRVMSNSNNTRRPLTIRIEAPVDFIFPWALLYEGELSEIKREQFWGFKYIIQDRLPNLSYPAKIDASQLVISSNVYPGFDTEGDSKEYSIDPVTGSGCLEALGNFIGSIKGAKPVYRPDPEKFMNDFKDESPFNDSIIYFLCHAEYMEDPSVWNSYILLGKKLLSKYIEYREGKVVLGKLKPQTKKPLKKQTLVFLNACESAVMPFTFFEGFIPYFIERKAQGVIGTCSKIPLKFASRFGLEFLKLLLLGKTVDEIMYCLRKRFLDKYDNLLGLYYISRCNPNLSLNVPLLSFDKTSMFDEREEIMSKEFLKKSF